MRKNVNLNRISFLVIISGLLFGAYFIPIIRNNDFQESKDLELFTSSLASNFNYAWNRTWGDIYDDEVCPYMESGMAIDSSNNIYVTGRIDTTGTSNYNIVLIKCNSQGVEQWVRIWDGGASEEGNSILIENSNEIYVVGITTSYADPDGDMVVIKYDGSGNQLWNFTWGGTELDSAHVIIKDSSDNYYIAGETRSLGDVDGDAVLIKFDSNWIEQWNVTWGGSDRDYANAIEIDSFGSICVVGGSYSSDPTSGEADVMILKYNSSGSLIWDRDWGISWTQRGPGIAIDSNDNLYFVGHTFGNPASSMKGHLVKYDTDGTYQWERIWGVDGVYGNSWRSVVIDSEDEIYICGASTTHGPYTGTADIILLNYDTSGNQNWYKTWGMPGDDAALSLNFDSQKNLYLAGFTESIGVGGDDIILMKYNHSQNQLPNLNIITPENKTYTGADSGYYPATYGFESDETGTNVDFIDLEESTGSCTLTLIPEFNNHKRVLDLYDSSSSYSAGGKNIFDSGQDYGTIEFWWALSDVTRTSYVWLEDSSANDILVVRYSGIDFGRFDSGGWQAISGAPSPSNNQWYHIRIDWELTAGGYMGLAQNNFSIYINGVQYGPYTVAITNTPDRIYLQTGVGASGGFHFYVDAVGYSWDPYYSIGDNINEGLLLSYESSANLEWEGYSLDYQANKTILGNTTISVPANGPHKIQVFGNNSIGTMYKSNTRHFSVDTNPFIDILTPENNTYTNPDSGYYAATYSFENDVDTTVPQFWVDNSQSGCSAKVVSEKNGHKKVVYLDDDSGNKIYFDNYFPAQTHGTIELWVLAEDATSGFAIRTFDSGGSFDPYAGAHMVYFGFGSQDKWSYTDGTGTTTIIPSYDGVYDPVDNTWYHVSIHFRCNNSPSFMGLSENSYKLIIDGRESVELEASFGNIVNHVDRFDIATSAAATTDGWVDAIAFSWDQSYDVGDNLNEGLFLSYDTNIDFNWTGYSLDGEANRTVLGNTTIPMPADGQHNIQVFGNDSMGATYESGVRYFTTNALGPDITIHSPISNQFYGTLPPDFSLSIPDSDLDARWYSLDGGTTNIPFSGLSGTIVQNEWNKIGNGTATLTFYANDTANNIGQEDVTVRKDIIAPVIDIVTPSTGVELDYTPIFEISISENNLDEFWYTIDNGVNNYTISSLTGTINQAVWNAASYGPVTIRFYAKDKAGNIGTNSVIVAKISSDEPPPAPPPGIPGYDLYLLLGALGIISTLIIRKRSKS